jgi:hypothetical protein
MPIQIVGSTPLIERCSWMINSAASWLCCLENLAMEKRPVRLVKQVWWG